jgi:hypothetical protein
MQIDLQPPLAITKITHGDSQLKFEREGSVYWVMFEKDIPKGVGIARIAGLTPS